MADRESYEPGTPCWVDHSSTDPEGAASFYGELFGWDAEDAMPAEEPVNYFICSLRGRPVAACGTQQAEGTPAMWNTYVTVSSADEAVEKATAAGGSAMGEAFDVFDSGRMAALTDPAGAWICVWEPKEMQGAGLVNEPGALAWNELTTRDPEGSKSFYGALFGWTAGTMEFAGGEYTLWGLEGTEDPTTQSSIGGMMPMVGDQWPADMPPHWMVYFAVEDTDATAAGCDQAGGKVSVPAFDSEVGRIAVLNDPQGAVFSIIQPPEGGFPT